MGTMIFISSVAMLVGIVGSFFIWRLDASRAQEIEHERERVAPAALPVDAGGRHKEIGPR